MDYEKMWNELRERLSDDGGVDWVVTIMKDMDRNQFDEMVRKFLGKRHQAPASSCTNQ